MRLKDLEMNKNLTSKNAPQKQYYLVYARKSEEAEDKQIQSIEDQLRIAEQIKKQRGLEVLQVFSEARSAKQPGRPQFNKMIDMIHSRNDIKGIIVWKFNRLSRNPQDEGTLRWLLQSGRIEEIVTPEKTYTPTDSDFIMAIEGAQAQRFINDLRKDTARGVQSKLDKGHAPYMAPPGYRNTTEKRQGERHIEAHPVYFPLVRKIFDLALTGDYSVEKLHEQLKEMNIKNGREQIVSRTQLYKMLKDPFYTGIRFVYAGRLYTNGAHERMITDEEFDLIQDILKRRSRPRVYTHVGFLNGLVRCGECSAMVTAEVHRKKYKNGKTQDFAYYRCTKRKKGMKCSQPYLPVDSLDEQAITYLNGITLSPRFVEWAIKWLKVMHENQSKLKGAKIEATQHEYNETLKQIDRVVDLMVAGILSPQEGGAKKQQLEDKKTRIFSQLSNMDTHVNEINDLTIKTFEFIKKVREQFRTGTMAQKKTILRVIGSNLILKDRKLSIELRRPFKYVQEVATELQESNGEIEANLPKLNTQEAFIIAPVGTSQILWGE
jgi:site-specific DNA recombinase